MYLCYVQDIYSNKGGVGLLQKIGNCVGKCNLLVFYKLISCLINYIAISYYLQTEQGMCVRDHLHIEQ